MDMIKILQSRYPDKKWKLDGDSYAGLTILDEGEKPTEAELEALWPEVQAEMEAAEEKVKVEVEGKLPVETPEEIAVKNKREEMINLLQEAETLVDSTETKTIAALKDIIKKIITVIKET